nr:RecName: Full=56 kDa cell wall protein [Daucus carota]
SQEDTPL